MSLILEALRKSEAERRRGQVPDLHTGPSPGAPPLRDARRAWLWPALALATVVVLAISLWLAVSAPPPSTAHEAADAATGLAGGRSVDSDGDASLEAAPIGTVGSSGMPDSRASAGAVPAWMPPPNRQPDVARTPAAPSAAAATPTSTRAPVTANAPGPAAAAATAAPARPLPPAPAVRTTPAPHPAPDAVVSTGATAAPAATLPAAPESSPLRLSDLAVAQRQQLPPLKMSMHMYSPTQRFAIIDGTRVARGDRIGDAVVEEITANGVVLDWQGQRLQIPIR